MARIFDIIEYPNEMRNEIVHRFPETGPGDFRIGSQVIVRESQLAVFFRDGTALDVFGPGRHTIVTANIPLLIEKIGKALFNERTPFPAEVYFVSMREFADQKWGTPQPILVRTPGMGIGLSFMQGFGTFGFQVKDAQQFVTQIVGAQGMLRIDDIENRLRSMLLSKLSDLLGETASKHAVPELIGLTEEIGAGVRAKASPDFEAIGLSLKAFYIENMRPVSKSLDELIESGLVPPDVYAQIQAAKAMRDAAQNPSGGAGLTAGIGAGLGIGNVMNQALGSAMQSGQPAASASPAAGAASGAVMADVMTPSEAAAILKVSEEDVIAAITAGDLKARKLGNAYRISKAALEEFLKG
jgi:excisionase family DNA binding protein